MSISRHLEQADFAPADNEQKCACVLLLDTSTSMQGEPINKLNEGLKLFESTLKEDALTSIRVEPLVITFDSQVVVHGEFVTADVFDAPRLTASGNTMMGAAIKKALELVEERKSFYKRSSLTYYRPWIFLITDGGPTDSADFVEACQLVQTAEEKNKVEFFAVGVEGANMTTLSSISKRRVPLPLKGLRFEEMFVWLSRSLEGVSRSQPGTQVSFESPQGWAGTS